MESIIGCGTSRVFGMKRQQEKHTFVGYVQISSDKKATLLKSTAPGAYPKNVLLLNVSVSYRKWLIENGQHADRIPVCIVVRRREREGKRRGKGIHHDTASMG